MSVTPGQAPADTATTEQPAPAAATQDTAPQVDAEKPTSESDEPRTLDRLPKWAQDLVAELRRENAGHRKEKTAAERAAQEAEERRLTEQGEYKALFEKTNAKLTALEAEIATRDRQERARAVCERVQLPVAFALRLRGETDEELEADARALLEVIPKPQAPPTEGSRGTNGPVAPPQPPEAAQRQTTAHYRRAF